jgi:mannose-6-phosphate isomerase class I
MLQNPHIEKQNHAKQPWTYRRKNPNPQIIVSHHEQCQESREATH